MSAPAAHGLIIEHVYTRDFLVPIFAFRQWVGWDCYPVPPSEPALWEIFDMSPDDKTGWRRIRWGAR